MGSSVRQWGGCPNGGIWWPDAGCVRCDHAGYIGDATAFDLHDPGAGNGAWDQYFSIPQIKAGSFVVVQSPIVNMSSGVEAWWSPGTLHLRRAQSLKWTVKVLSYGDAPDATTKYGIRARNDNNLVQIDNVNKVMSVAGSGSFQIGRRGPGDYITTGRGNFRRR